VRFDLFAENRSDIDYDDLCVTVKGLPESVHLTSNDASVCFDGSDYVINMGKLASRSTNCIHATIR